MTIAFRGTLTKHSWCRIFLNCLYEYCLYVASTLILIRLRVCACCHPHLSYCLCYFLQHQNKYKLEDLGGDKRLYSLEICIAECDRGTYVILMELLVVLVAIVSCVAFCFCFEVIRETKGNSTDNPVYAKAKDLVTKAWKLKEDLLKEGRNWGELSRQLVWVIFL